MTVLLEFIARSRDHRLSHMCTLRRRVEPDHPASGIDSSFDLASDEECASPFSPRLYHVYRSCTTL